MSVFQSPTVGQARDFAWALRQAVRDRRLEDSGETITYYFDTAVVIDAVKGLARWELDDEAPDVSGWNDLLLALLTTGYAPRVYLLRPHLVEFHAHFQSVTGLPDRQVEEARELAARGWGMAPEEREAVLSDGEAFAEYLRTNGAEIFVRLQLLEGGRPVDRLARMFRSHRFAEGPGPEVPTVLSDDPLFRSFLRRIKGGKPWSDRSINNVTDALALSMLARTAEAGRHVRFYTTDVAVRAALEDPPKGVTRPDDLFRSEEYFVTRVSFPSLSFKGASVDGGPGLDDLDRLATDILGALEAYEDGGPETVEAALERVASDGVDQRTVPELLQAFYGAQFVSTMLLEHPLPEDMAEVFPTLYKAREHAELVTSAKRSLSEEVERIYNDLTREVGELRRWQRDFARLMRDAEKRGRQFDDFIPDRLWVDLGLGRWGLHEVLGGERTRAIDEGVRAVLSEGPGRANVCGALSLALATASPPIPPGQREAPDPSSEEWLDGAAYVMCLLWALRTHDLLQDAGKRLVPAQTDGDQRLLHRLRIVAFVGEVKDYPFTRGGQTIEAHLTELTEQANRLIDETPDGDEHGRAYAEMGLAHASYWVWVHSGLRRTGPGLEAARVSFEAGCRAVEALAPGSLGWAFAVNHAAYVGLKAGLERERTRTYVRVLKSQIPPDFDHYRIKDTEALVYLEDVKRAVAEGRADEERPALCSDLAEALRLLEVHPGFGDQEIGQHYGECRDLARELGCPGR